MELSFTQFRSAIQARITEMQTLPPTPSILAEIAELQALLANIPVDSDE